MSRPCGTGIGRQNRLQNGKLPVKQVFEMGWRRLRLDYGEWEGIERAEPAAERERMVSRVQQWLYGDGRAAPARGAGAGGWICARDRAHRRAAGVSRSGDSH